MSSTSKDNIEWKSLFKDYYKYLALLNNPHIDEYTKSSAYFTLTKVKHKIGIISTIYIKNEKINLSEEPIDFSLFSQLDTLKLDGCSIKVIHNLFLLHEKLKILSIENLNINNDTNIFLDINHQIEKNGRTPINYATINDSLYWKKLIKLKLSYCNLQDIENSFSLFPNVTSLDLSHNQISEIKNLQNCKYLISFNISYNNISHVSDLSINCKNVKRLNISHNAIKNLPSSIQYLIHLEKLILSYNHISDFYELTSLSQIKSLLEIVLMGNPLSSSKYYRCLVFYSILGSQLSLSLSSLKYATTSSQSSLSLALDGSSIRKHEIQTIRLLLHTPEESYDRNQSFYSSKSMVVGGAKVVMIEQIMSTKLSHLWRDPKRWSLNHSRILLSHSDPAAYDDDDDEDGCNNLLTSNSRASSLYCRVTSKRKIGCSGRKLVNIYDCWDELLRDKDEDSGCWLGVFVNVSDATDVWLARRRLEDQVSEAKGVADITTTTATVLPEKNASISISPDESQPDEAIRLQSISREINSRELDVGSNGNNIVPVTDLQESSMSATAFTGSNSSSGNPITESVGSLIGQEPSQQSLDRIFPAEYPQSPPRNSNISKGGGGGGGLFSTDHLDHTTSDKEYSPYKHPELNSDDVDVPDTKEEPSVALTAAAYTSSPSPSTASSPPSIKRYFSRKMFPFASLSPRKTGLTSPTRCMDSQQSVEEEDSPSLHGSLPADVDADADGPVATPSKAEELHAAVSSPVSAFPSQHILSDLTPSRHRDLISVLSPSQHQEKENDKVKDRDKEFQRLLSRYTGNSEYSSYLVVDNLELYFREQVFGMLRPSYPSPYIRYRYRYNTQDNNNSNNNNMIGTSTLLSLRQTGFSVHAGGNISYFNDNYSDFISANASEERFVCLFREPVIFLNDSYSNVNVNANATADSDTNSIVRSDPEEEGGVDGASTSAAAAGEEEEEDGYDDKESCLKETTVLIVITNQYVYFLEDDLNPSDRIAKDETDTVADTAFSDAPIPLLIGRHSLLSIRQLTSYFGLTRLALHFSDDSSNDPLTNATDNSIDSSDCMIVFRNKAKSHSFLNVLNMATRSCASLIASESGNTTTPSHSSYVIENTDSQFLEEVTACLHSLSVTTSRPYDMEDVQYVQMVFQVWRKKPGMKQPRTLVLTRSRLFLFDEQLDSLQVKLKLVNSARAKRVARVISEDDDHPLRLTLVLKGSDAKSANVFAFRRKWRLQSESREALWRLRDECRRVCSEVGNVL